MYGAAQTLILVLYVVLINLALPSAIIWGWVRWSKRVQPPTITSVLSLIGFALATASSLLAVSSLLYAHARGGFGFYDPLLMRIYGWGALLSASSFAFGLGGVWRRSPLRWYAPLCAIGTFLFWFGAAMGE
jgi:hypothetical protein